MFQVGDTIRENSEYRTLWIAETINRIDCPYKKFVMIIRPDPDDDMNLDKVTKKIAYPNDYTLVERQHD